MGQLKNKNPTGRRALFLDRDGVINVDHGYVYRRENFEFIDGIFELCVHAKNRDYLIFVVTNQAGIGRGYYTERDFWLITKWMCEEFRKRHTCIDKVYFCPFHENGIGAYRLDSPFRKPAPGMILEAADEFGVDLSASMLVGDKTSDIQAGKAAGVGCNVFFCSSPKNPDQDGRLIADKSVRRLRDVISLIR